MANPRSKLPFLAVLCLFAGAPALAAPCGTDSSGFGAWFSAFKEEAASSGVSHAVIERALRDVRYDPRIIARDRGQGGVFKQSFEDFSARLVTPRRVSRGKALMRRHAALLGKIERQYGVPGAVVLAIWGLETGYGADNGRFPIFNAVATLAYDCRRADTFRAELLDALRIVERGDMKPEEMRGDWAGEIGQTQLLPSSYLLYAVDFNARRNTRPHPRHSRRARLDREFPASQGMASRRRVQRRPSELRSLARMEQGARLRQDDCPPCPGALGRGGVTKLLGRGRRRRGRRPHGSLSRRPFVPMPHVDEEHRHNRSAKQQVDRQRPREALPDREGETRHPALAMVACRRDDADEIARLVEGVLEVYRAGTVITRLDIGHRYGVEVFPFPGGAADIAHDADFHFHVAQFVFYVVQRDDHMSSGGNILAKLHFRRVRQIAGEIHDIGANEQAAAPLGRAEPAVGCGRRAEGQRKCCDH